jgi:hypothetical protein
MTRLFSVLLVALFVAAPAFAHPGHDHKVTGTIAVIHENHLEVTDAQGKTTALMLDAKTKILRGKAAVKAADLKVGDRVVVTAAESKGKDGKITLMVKLIQVGAAAQTKTAGAR